MKKIKITTPENIELELPVASVLSRCIAGAIDQIIQIGIMILIYIGTIGALDLINANIYSPKIYMWIIAGLLIVYTSVNYLYYVVLEMTMNGRSIGKKMMHLRVIRNNGSALTIRHSLSRNLFRVMLDNFGIGVIMMFFSKEGKRLGDMVASTIVIVEQEEVAPITLDHFIEIDDEIREYLTEDEYEILRQYYMRKNEMIYNDELKMQLQAYFKNKFESLGMAKKGEIFIKKI